MRLGELVYKWKISLKQNIRRFPITIVLCLITVMILITMSELTDGYNGDLIENLRIIAMTLALGIPISLSIQLYFEGRKDYKNYWKYICYVVSTILLCGYGYFFIDNLNMVQTTRYIGFTLLFYLIFLFIPRIYKKSDFELYVIKILGRFFVTTLYSIILYLGIVAIIFTLDYLLGINIKGEIYYYSWLIVVGIFASCFFFAGIPTEEENMQEENYPKILKVLLIYIIMPLISIYTLILYIYFIKIIITMQWPEGLVSHLVLWYGVISVSVIFLISPIGNNIKWVKKYMNIFPKVILPLIVMMFVSMGIRINAYGITENRYFVLALGIWIFGSMSYLSTSKKRKNIILPISLAVITFISVCGPLSSYSISKYSQNKRLERLLIKNNMLIDDKATKTDNEVSKEDSLEISNILNYFDRNHSLEEVKSMPEGFKIKDMEEVLGIKYHYDYYDENYKYFYFTVDESSEPMEIKGYEYLFYLNNYAIYENKNGNLTISLNRVSTELKIFDKGKEIYSKELGEYFKILVEKYNTNSTGDIPREEMQFQDETDKIKIKLQFNSINGRKDVVSGDIDSTELQFYLLVKLK